LEQIEAFVKHPPKAVWGNKEAVLRKHARIEDIIRVLRESEDPGVRIEICFFFDQTMLKSGREAVLATLFDTSPQVRYQAADAYAKIGRPEDGPIVMAALRLERSEKVRSYLVFALGAIQYQAAAPTLIKLLHAGKQRYSTIEALGELRGPEIRNALVAELETETVPGWRNMIKRSIAFIDARALRDEIEARGETVPRSLTAQQIEQIVLNPPPDIWSPHPYLQIHASEEELRKAIMTSEHLSVRNAAEWALMFVRHRDKRGY
jgi:HEAT repeat protein